MKAKFINEFERGQTSKGAMTVGKEKISGDFDQHLKDVRSSQEQRSEEQKFLDEASNLYAFIWRPSYEAVEIDGEEFHKKTIEIENLYQIDRYDKGDLMAIRMMKIRATAQDDKSKVALVDIPTFMHNQKTAYNDDISPELRKYIIENKRKVTG